MSPQLSCCDTGKNINMTDKTFAKREMDRLTHKNLVPQSLGPETHIQPVAHSLAIWYPINKDKLKIHRLINSLDSNLARRIGVSKCMMLKLLRFRFSTSAFTKHNQFRTDNYHGMRHANISKWSSHTTRDASHVTLWHRVFFLIKIYARILDWKHWFIIACHHRADSMFAPSQRETSLQSNAVSHWLSANLESAAPLSQTRMISIPLRNTCLRTEIDSRYIVKQSPKYNEASSSTKVKRAGRCWLQQKRWCKIITLLTPFE